MKKFVIFCAVLISALFLVSCGGTTVKVKQSSDGVNATVSVQTNNPTDVQVNPSVSVKLDDLSELLNIGQDTLSFDSNGEMVIDTKTLRNIVKHYQ